MPHALEHAHKAGFGVRVRTVRVAVLVGEIVVLAVVSDPADRRALHRHAAENREGRAHHGRRLEGAVGEQTVVADVHTKAGDHVHESQNREVERVNEPAPEQIDGCSHTKQWKHHRGNVYATFECAHGASNGNMGLSALLRLMPRPR